MTDEKHTFDTMFWCVDCGAGMQDVANGVRSVECDKRIHGISHIVRPKSLYAVANALSNSEW